MAAAEPARSQLRVGRLVKAHGLKGALKVELYTDDPDGRFTPGAVFTQQVPAASPWHGKTVTVREFRWMNSHPVVFLEGVDDRNAADELVRAILWIDQDTDEESTEDDAWYDHQLVGLDVVRDGEVVGRIGAILSAFAGAEMMALNLPFESVFLILGIPAALTVAGLSAKGIFAAGNPPAASPSPASVRGAS